MSMTSPGESNTFVPGFGGARRPQQYQAGALSPADIQQIAAAMAPTIKGLVVEAVEELGGAVFGPDPIEKLAQGKQAPAAAAAPKPAAYAKQRQQELLNSADATVKQFAKRGDFAAAEAVEAAGKGISSSAEILERYHKGREASTRIEATPGAEPRSELQRTIDDLNRRCDAIEQTRSPAHYSRRAVELATQSLAKGKQLSWQQAWDAAVAELGPPSPEPTRYQRERAAFASAAKNGFRTQRSPLELETINLATTHKIPYAEARGLATRSQFAAANIPRGRYSKQRHDALVKAYVREHDKAKRKREVATDAILWNRAYQACKAAGVN